MEEASIAFSHHVRIHQYLTRNIALRRMFGNSLTRQSKGITPRRHCALALNANLADFLPMCASEKRSRIPRS